MRGKQRSRQSTAAVLTVITLVCKVFGFLKNSVMAYYFGTGAVVDAYVMTFAIGTITSGWIAGLIGNITPVLKKIELKENRSEKLLVAANIKNWLYILIFVLIILLELLAAPIVRIVAPGFSGERFDLTVRFFRIYIFSIAFYTGFRFFRELLNCDGHHLEAMFPDVLMSSICIVAIFVSARIGKDFLIFGYVVAIAIEFAWEAVFARKNGFRQRAILRWDENIRAILVMAVPIFLSDTLAEINTMIDKMFASNLMQGSVAALDYANTMKDFLYQLGTIAIITIIFPVLSGLWAEKNLDGFRNSVMNGINYMTVLYVPVTLGVVAVGGIVIQIVYARGAFDSTAAAMTTDTFILYSLGLLALAYRCIFFKAFHAMQNTRYILWVSLANVGLNIVLNAALVKGLQHNGLALATSLSSILCLPLYFGLFKKAVPDVRYKAYGAVLWKAVVSGAVMFCGVMLVKYTVFASPAKTIGYELLELFTLFFLGVGLYGVLCKLLKVEEVDALLKQFLKKRKAS